MTYMNSQQVSWALMRISRVCQPEFVHAAQQPTRPGSARFQCILDGASDLFAELFIGPGTYRTVVLSHDNRVLLQLEEMGHILKIGSASGPFTMVEMIKDGVLKEDFGFTPPDLNTLNQLIPQVFQP